MIAESSGKGQEFGIRSVLVSVCSQEQYWPIMFGFVTMLTLSMRVTHLVTVNYTRVSSYQAIWLDKRHSVSADTQYNSTGTFNFMYHST